MEYKELVDKASATFYKNYSPKMNYECFNKQAKILTIATLSVILENEFNTSDEHILKQSKTAAGEIDEEIFSDPEIMSYANLSIGDKRFYFSFLAIKRTIKRLKAFEESISKNSLENSISDFKNLLFTIYIRPLSSFDDEDYFERYPFELLQLKPIFINDYFDLKKTLKSLI